MVSLFFISLQPEFFLATTRNCFNRVKSKVLLYFIFGKPRAKCTFKSIVYLQQFRSSECNFVVCTYYCTYDACKIHSCFDLQIFLFHSEFASLTRSTTKVIFTVKKLKFNWRISVSFFPILTLPVSSIRDRDIMQMFYLTESA